MDILDGLPSLTSEYFDILAPGAGSDMVLGAADLVASTLWQICCWKEISVPRQMETGRAEIWVCMVGTAP